jgi:hypothetical protein
LNKLVCDLTANEQINNKLSLRYTEKCKSECKLRGFLVCSVRHTGEHVIWSMDLHYVTTLND